MRTFTRIALAAVVAVSLFTTGAYAGPDWDLMGATIHTERDTMQDHITIPDLTAYAGRGATSTGLEPVGFIAESESPFNFLVYDDYGTETSVTYVDSTGAFVHLPADPYTLTGPAWPCKYVYYGSPNIVQFNFSADDTTGHANLVQVRPIYDLPE